MKPLRVLDVAKLTEAEKAALATRGFDCGDVDQQELQKAFQILYHIALQNALQVR